MKQFFQSGAAFLIVALLCFAAALFSHHHAVFTGVGGVWLLVAIAVRRKSLSARPFEERS